jgi:hypothetical protein
VTSKTLAIAALALVLAGSAQAGTFQVGIVDPHPLPSADALALGASYHRSTLYWQGETTYTGKLYFTPGVKPFVLVMGSSQFVPENQAARDRYCGFVRSILVRYPNVKAIGIWGEPSQLNFAWGGKPLSLYGAMLKTCAPIIRSFGAIVVGPQAHPTIGAQIQPLLNAIQAAGPHLLDVVSIDPYWYAGDLPNFVHRARATFGWKIPVWIAEDGIDTVPSVPFASLYYGVTPANWNYWTSEQGQAGVVRAHMIYAYCAGAVLWSNFLLRDEPNLARWQSGLERPNGSHKPAYDTVAKTSRDISAGRISCDQAPPRWTPDELLAQRLGETGGWTRDAYATKQTADADPPLKHATIGKSRAARNYMRRQCFPTEHGWVCPLPMPR